MKLLLSTSMLFIIVLITPLFAQTEKEATAPETWEPQVAGRFYLGNETALKDQITAFFKTSQSNNSYAHCHRFSPGWLQYSGQVVAYGYSVIRDYGFNRATCYPPAILWVVNGSRRFRAHGKSTQTKYNHPRPHLSTN